MTTEEPYNDTEETDWIIAGYTESWHPTSASDTAGARAEFLEWLSKHDAHMRARFTPTRRQLIDVLAVEFHEGDPQSAADAVLALLQEPQCADVTKEGKHD